MISNPNFSRYRNGEFVSFIDNILELSQAFDLDALGLRGRWDTLNKIYQELLTVYKVSRGQSLTKQLVILDQKRDQLFLGFYDITNEHARFHPDNNVKTLTQNLLDVLLIHGRDIHKKSYQEESAALEDLIEKITAGNFTTLMDRLDLTVYFEGLIKANNEFNELYLKRNTKYAEIKKGEMERLRKETEEAYDSFVRIIMALAEINGMTDYETLIDQINSLIGKYITEINRRLSQPEETNPETDSDLDVVEGEE